MFKKGTIITAIHNQSGSLLYYKIVQDQTNKKYRLLNISSLNIMAYIETTDPNDFRDYIVNKLKCSIIKVSD